MPPCQPRRRRSRAVEQVLSDWEDKVGRVWLELLAELPLLLLVLKVGRCRWARSRNGRKWARSRRGSRRASSRSKVGWPRYRSKVG